MRICSILLQSPALSVTLCALRLVQLYADLFAMLTLLLGGGLAIYGLLLYSKMLRVQSGQTSADLGKVATLAIVCLICFLFRALLVLVNNLRDERSQEGTDPVSSLYPLLTLAYYAVGESVPSIFVLICLREMPGGGSKQRRPLSTGALLEEPLLVPAASGLPPAEAVQPAVAPWSVASLVTPEPGGKALSAPTSTLEHPRRAKTHALGSKRPIGRRYSIVVYKRKACW